MKAEEMSLRAFVCVEPPPEVTDEIERYVAALRAFAPRGEYKWVSRAQLHLTLRFLGEAPARKAASMDRALRALGAPGAFEITVAGGGGFPNLNRPRVLWMGVRDGLSALGELAGLVEEAAVSSGYERESRKFTAHLTLARLRGEGFVPEALKEALSEVGKPPAFSWRCRGFVLKRSVLTPSGPVYTNLGEYGLRT